MAFHSPASVERGTKSEKERKSTEEREPANSPVVSRLQRIRSLTQTILNSRWTKVAVFIGSLAPLGGLIAGWFGWFGMDLGGNPIEDVTHETGEFALKYVLATMAITPVRKLFGIPELIRYRRMLGLFAFFYGVLHLFTWVWMDKFFDIDAMLADVIKRRYITMGVISFVVMLPLALTSTAGWIARMGGRHWQALHRLIYVAAIAGVIHYYWLVKSDVSDPLMYAGATVALLGVRAWVGMRG